MKKVLSFFLAAVIINCITVVSFASSVLGGTNTIQFLNDLGITQKTEENSADSVKRGEFVSMVVNALNIEKTDASEIYFEDVNENSPYYDEISEAAHLGIISGDGIGKFFPDGKLSFAAAIKITVCALGYKNIAASYGGYPAGYLAVSAETDLLHGIKKNINEYMNFSECAELLYNFLNADLCLTTGMDGNYPVQGRAEGKCILSEYYGLCKNEGIITGAGFASLESEAVRDGSLTLSGKKFKYNGKNAEEYLGLSAVCWTDDRDEIKLIYIKPINKCVKIEADNIKDYSGHMLMTYDTEYKLDRSVSISKNGKYILADNNVFTFDNGYVTLIDNDGDGIYNAALVMSAKYLTVSAVNETKEEVYDAKEGALKLQNDGEHRSVIKLKNKDGVLENSDFKDITVGTVLMYYGSDDDIYTLAEGCVSKVEGTVTETLKNKIFIDGTVYETNTYFNKNYNVTPGFEGTFLLAADGTVTATADSETSDLPYGYLTGYKAENNVTKSVQISIFTTNGNFIYPELADNVTLDGVRMARSDHSLSNALVKNGAPNYGVIRYNLDGDGKVNVIDTAEEVDASLQPFDKYGKTPVGDNVLTRYAKKVKAFYYPNLNQFVPYALIDTAVIIGVPYDISNDEGGTVYDESKFSILNSQTLANSKTYEIDTYDVSRAMRPAIVVVYDKNAGVSLDVGKHEDAAVIIGVSNTVSENGEILKTFYMWKNGTYCKYRLAADTAKLLEADGITLAAGDVIRFALNGDNEISRLVKDASYNEVTRKPEVISAALEGHQVDCAEYAGTVLYHTGSALTLKLDSISAYSENYSTALSDNVLPLSVKETTRIAIYDTEKQTVTQGTVDDLRDGYSVGEENGSYVFIKGYSGGINQMIIYR